MTVHKCDVCKKTIGENEDAIRIEFKNSISCFLVCLVCAKAILIFLQKNKLIEKKNSI